MVIASRLARCIERKEETEMDGDGWMDGRIG
jgi:hypothetical protein